MSELQASSEEIQYAGCAPVDKKNTMTAALFTYISNFRLLRSLEKPKSLISCTRF